MKAKIFCILALLGLLSMACTISFNVPASRTGETKTFTINEAAPTSGPAIVDIAMLGGDLNISGGSDALVTGSIDYNLAEWQPKIERSTDTVRISQEAKTIPIPGKVEMVNRWNLQLGSTPMFLKVSAGAYDGTINLSGVPLTGFEMQGGASTSQVRFDSPNPQPMDSFVYKTGASNVEIFGLANAGPSTFTFTGGAGEYRLDFSGQMQRAMTADINGAFGTLNIIVPAGVSAQVNLTGGLRDVKLEGDWSVSDEVYKATGSEPGLVINVQMSFGQLKLAIE